VSSEMSFSSSWVCLYAHLVIAGFLRNNPKKKKKNGYNTSLHLNKHKSEHIVCVFLTLCCLLPNFPGLGSK